MTRVKYHPQKKIKTSVKRLSPKKAWGRWGTGKR
jgi:hypothetical protein